MSFQAAAQAKKRGAAAVRGGSFVESGCGSGSGKLRNCTPGRKLRGTWWEILQDVDTDDADAMKTELVNATPIPVTKRARNEKK